MSAIHGLIGGTVTALGISMVVTARAWPAAHPEVRGVLDEVSLSELLDGGEVEANGFERCPAEQRTTFHAIRRDGSRRCWTCNSESPAGAP